MPYSDSPKHKYAAGGGDGGSRTRVRNKFHFESFTSLSRFSNLEKYLEQPTILIENQDLTCYKQDNHF